MYSPRKRPRIVIACSGLGHVRRGIEAWASDLAHALRDADADVTLFAGAPIESAVSLMCLRRDGRATMVLAWLLRRIGGWRVGLSSAYDIEQASFAISVWRKVRRRVDVVHVQDPRLATLLEWAWRRGLSSACVVYANGTGEPAEVMRRFRALQLLTPDAYEAWSPRKPPAQLLFMTPNLVDPDVFVPGDIRSARAAFELPSEGRIVLCCAAIRRFHKRIDYLIDEFARVADATDATLVVAGAREADTDELVSLGRARLGPRVRFLVGTPRAAMPTLYRAADVFVLPSLQEMFGIVLLEALATGLPVICNDTPAFRYVAGPAGCYADLTQPGALATTIETILQGERRGDLAANARAHVIATFSAQEIARQVLSIYDVVLRATRSAA